MEYCNGKPSSFITIAGVLQTFIKNYGGKEEHMALYKKLMRDMLTGLQVVH